MAEMRRLFRSVAQGASPVEAISAQAAESDAISQRVEQWRNIRSAQVGMPPELLDILLSTNVTDVLINGTDVWVDQGDGLTRANWSPDSNDQAIALARNMAAAAGKRLDDASPMVDGFLGKHFRLHAVLTPLAVPPVAVSLRVLGTHQFTIADPAMVRCLTVQGVSLVRHLVTKGVTALISGPTGSGKTTLVAVLLGLVPDNQRIVCVEEVAELSPLHPHVVHLQERNDNVEGSGGVGLSDLVRAALRMRPDWLVLGECRGREILEVLSALNTGHRGFTTIHANSVVDVPARLGALGALAGLSDRALAAYVRAAFPVVLHMQRHGGVRQLTEVGVFNDEGPLTCLPALQLTAGELTAGPGLPRLRDTTGWSL